MLIGVLTLYRLYRPRPLAQLFFCANQPVVIARGLVWGLAAAYLLFTSIIYFIANSANWFGLDWESSHFLWRLKLTEVYGMRPYFDYQFEYGPALAYAPILAHALFSPLGTHHELSYYAAHYVLNVAGLLCIVYILNRACVPLPLKSVAFIALGLASFLPNMGLNGVVLRYSASFFGLVAVHGAAYVRKSHFVRLFGTALVCSGVNIVLSPEVGVAFLLALMSYCVLSLGDRTATLAILLAIVASLILAAFLLPRPYFATLTHFSQGANNLPLLITSPHLLLYLALILSVVPRWLAGVRGTSPDRALVATLAVLCVILIPGALGR